MTVCGGIIDDASWGEVLIGNDGCGVPFGSHDESNQRSNDEANHRRGQIHVRTDIDVTFDYMTEGDEHRISRRPS